MTPPLLAIAATALLAGSAHAAAWSSPSLLAGGLAPSLAVDPAGDATILWEQSGSGSNSLMAATRPSGGAWSSPVTLDPAYDGAAAVAVDRAGNFTAVWFSYNSGGYDEVLSATLPAGTSSWSAPVTVDADTGFGSSVAVVADATGNVTAAWTTRSSGLVTAPPVLLTSTKPAGGSWSTPAQLDTTVDQVSLAVDGGGNVIASWNDATSSGGAVRYATLPSGGSWSSPGTVYSSTAYAPMPPSVAVDSAGNATVIWIQEDSAGNTYGLLTASRPAGGSWSTPEALVSTSSSSYVEQASLAVDGAGDATVVWMQSGGGVYPIRAASRPAGGSWSSPVTLDANSSVGVRPAVIADPNGNVTALWGHLDSSSSAGTLDAASEPAGGAWSAPVTVDTTGYYDSPVMAGDATGSLTAAYVTNSSSLWTVSMSAPPSKPANLSPPTISGTASQGSVLTGHHGSWTGAPTSYTDTWLRCDANGQNCGPTGTTGLSYTPTSADVGSTIELAEQAGNSTGDSAVVDSLATPVVSGAPTTGPGPGSGGGAGTGGGAREPELAASYQDPTDPSTFPAFGTGAVPRYRLGDPVSASGTCADAGSGVGSCTFIDSVGGTTDASFPSDGSFSGSSASGLMARASFTAAGLGTHVLTLYGQDGGKAGLDHISMTYQVVAPPPPAQQQASDGRAVGGLKPVRPVCDAAADPRHCKAIFADVAAPDAFGVNLATLTDVALLKIAQDGRSAVLYPENGAQVIAVHGNVIAVGGANVVNAGGANVINAGGANVIAAGGANLFELVMGDQVIAAGGANVINAGGANLISDKGLGVINAGGANVINAGGANVINAGGANLISDKGLGLIGDSAQLLTIPSASLQPAPTGVGLLSGAFASSGLISGTGSSMIAGGGGFGVDGSSLISGAGGNVINAGGANAADIARARPGRGPQLASVRAIVPRAGQRVSVLLSFNARGKRILKAAGRINATRRAHHRRLLSLVLRVRLTFRPSTGAPAVTRTKTVTVTPLAATKAARKKR